MKETVEEFVLRHDVYYLFFFVVVQKEIPKFF